MRLWFWNDIFLLSPNCWLQLSLHTCDDSTGFTSTEWPSSANLKSFLIVLIPEDWPTLSWTMEATSLELLKPHFPATQASLSWPGDKELQGLVTSLSLQHPDPRKKKTYDWCRCVESSIHGTQNKTLGAFTNLACQRICTVKSGGPLRFHMQTKSSTFFQPWTYQFYENQRFMFLSTHSIHQDCGDHPDHPGPGTPPGTTNILRKELQRPPWNATREERATALNRVACDWGRSHNGMQLHSSEVNYADQDHRPKYADQHQWNTKNINRCTLGIPTGWCRPTQADDLRSPWTPTCSERVPGDSSWIQKQLQSLICGC